MKKRIVTLINLFLFFILCIANVLFMCNAESNNDSEIAIVFALFLFLVYVLGTLFPNVTVKIIHKIAQGYDQTFFNVPIFEEAKRHFSKRKIYILIGCNICLLLSLIVFLFDFLFD